MGVCFWYLCRGRIVALLLDRPHTLADREELHRVRRLSSTEPEQERPPPQVTAVQNRSVHGSPPYKTGQSTGHRRTKQVSSQVTAVQNRSVPGSPPYKTGQSAGHRRTKQVNPQVTAVQNRSVRWSLPYKTGQSAGHRRIHGFQNRSVYRSLLLRTSQFIGHRRPEQVSSQISAAQSRQQVATVQRRAQPLSFTRI